MPTVDDLPQPIGQSPAFLKLLERLSRVAPLDRPVLVVGERGTGKELIAARLHFLSGRWDGPFVKLNCAALPETLIDAELFGHEAGAFTGAQRRRRGRFELADGGTLFLDEIANASLAVQEKVLRAIEYGELERIGGDRTIKVEVRVVGATNLDLPAAAEAGTFRHDLLDRLSFDVLTVPPLRQRQDDIALLAQHFGRAMAHELEWPGFAGFTAEALDALEHHHWPGNVRELRNVVERALAHAREPGKPIARLSFDPFDSPYRPAVEPRPTVSGRTDKVNQGARAAPAEVEARHPFDLRSTVAAYERALLADVLEFQRHNQRATAHHLGLSYDQLRNSLKKHGLI
ncbi:MAG: phage shock protein operon transcriptional activator [Kiloniellales bacterium]